MLPRSGSLQVSRRLAQPSSFASSSRLPVRNLSYALTRPSAAALGKRPVQHGLLASASVGSVRHLSMNIFGTKRSFPSGEQIQPSPDHQHVPAGAHEPILTSSHPDLQHTPSTSTTTPSSSSSSSSASTSTPSSSATPDVPAPISTPPADLASTSADAISDASTKLFVPENATLGDLIAANPNVPVQTILDSQEAMHVLCQVDDLSAIGLSHGFLSPAGWTADGLLSLHNMTGLPWWATIATMTLMIRLILLKPLVNAQKHNTRMAAVGPQQTALMQRMTAATKAGKEQESKLANQALQQLWTSHNVHPLNAVKYPMMQLPVVLSMFYALRRLSELPIPEMHIGGLAWFTDLSVSDPYYILPITSIVLTNIVVRVGADGNASSNQQIGLARHVPNIVMVASCAGFFLIKSFPAAVLFYWTSTNTITLIQALLLKQQFSKRLFGIPNPPQLPPPPPGTAMGRATPVETWRAFMDHLKSTYRQSREKHESRVQAHEQQALSDPGTTGSAITREVIRERPVSSRPTVVSSGPAKVVKAPARGKAGPTARR